MVALEQPVPAVASGDARPARRDRLAIPALVAATVISSTGNQLTAIALPWFVLVTTGSAARTGLVAFAQTIPIVIAGLIGGAIVDRVGFKRMSVVSDLASGVTIALIPALWYLDLLPFWALLALAFLGALLDVPGHVARGALVPGLANRVGMSLERANAAMQLAPQAASIAGPLAAGVLIAATSEAAVLWFDAATFAVSALLIGVVVRYAHARRVDVASPSGPRAILRESLDGVRYFLSNRVLATLAVISLGANFLFAPFFAVLFPVWVRDEFGDPKVLGYLSAAFGTGSVVGIVLYGVLGARVARYPIFVLGALVTMAGTWVYPWSPPLAVAVAAGLLMGLAIGPLNIMFVTVMQERVPEEMLGRVYGALAATSQLLAPLALVTAGLAVEGLGVSAVLLTIAVLFSGLAAFIVLNPTVREIERPRPLQSPEAV